VKRKKRGGSQRSDVHKGNGGGRKKREEGGTDRGKGKKGEEKRPGRSVLSFGLALELREEKQTVLRKSSEK